MSQTKQTKITNYSLSVGEVTEDKGKFIVLSPTSENLKESNSYYPEFPEELALDKAVPSFHQFVLLSMAKAGIICNGIT